jgi:GT2 family glycosyltransferase
MHGHGMISAVIPSAGIVADGVCLLAGALTAAQACDEVLVVVTDGRMSTEGMEAIDAAGARIVEVSGPFNFSAAINAGVREARGDDVLLLNDDIALASRSMPDWPRRLAAKRGDVCGVQLWDAQERRIEHAGVWFEAAGGMPCHVGHGEPARRYRWRDIELLAVTGACQLWRRKWFWRIGGYDEAFALNYNDVDACLRLRLKGGRVLQVNTMTLRHRESSTRGPDAQPGWEDYKRLYDRHGHFLARQGVRMDPFAAARWREAVLG